MQKKLGGVSYSCITYCNKTKVLHGITPFYGDSVEEVFSNIRKGDVEFMDDEDPEDPFIQPQAKDIIQQFLDLDPQNRLTNPELIKGILYTTLMKNIYNFL